MQEYQSQLRHNYIYLCSLLFISLFVLQIIANKDSPRGTHFRRAGPRQRVCNTSFHACEFICLGPLRLFYESIIKLDIQVYFEPDEVQAAIVTCGGLCPGLNTVIRELVCGLYHMYGVKKILGISVSES